MDKRRQTKIPPIVESLLNWFTQAKRDLPWRRTADPYRIWVSEIMLQQTQVKTVLPYYEAFLKKFPTVESLARADLEEVLRVWQGLGYYSRARNLWKGARYVLETWEGRIPPEYKQLLQIPGVGEYTAGAIASIAFQIPAPAIDGNVQRVLARFLAWPHPIEIPLSRRAFSRQVLDWLPAESPGDFNQALMELGATLCSPKNPKCPACPLALGCQAFAANNFTYPLKRPKTAPTEITRLTFVLIRNGRIFFQQRPSKGLLAGMWELPGKELINPLNNLNETPAYTPREWFSSYQSAVRDRTYDAQVMAKLEGPLSVQGPAWHTFSHRRWKIYWILLKLDGPGPERPVPEQALINQPIRQRDMGFVRGEASFSDKEPAKGMAPPIYAFQTAEEVREEKSEYEGPGASEFPASDSQELKQRWVNLDSLVDIPIPAAFQEVLRHLPSE